MAAISDKWREIQKRERTQGRTCWRLITGCTFIRFCGMELRNYIATEFAEKARIPPIDPEVEFLGLEMLCDPGVEGWHVMPVPPVPVIRGKRAWQGDPKGQRTQGRKHSCANSFPGGSLCPVP